MDKTVRRDQQIEKALKTLLRGLTQNHLKEVYEGHGELYRIGKPAISYIQDAIFQSKWTSIRYANEVRYIAGLVSILHDIDECESSRIVQQLKDEGCHPSIRSILDSICKFTKADYIEYEFLGIQILEHKKLLSNGKIQKKLEGWLGNIPGKDLSGIKRIYVLRQEDMDSFGSYTPILCSIRILWNNPYSTFNPGSWINHFIIERTLYHEIGHHVYGHTFGQDEQQEKEADRYAEFLMANSSHLIFKILRTISGRYPTREI